MRVDSVRCSRRKGDAALALALFFPLEGESGRKKKPKRAENQPLSLSPAAALHRCDSQPTLWQAPSAAPPALSPSGKDGGRRLEGERLWWTRATACARESAQAAGREMKRNLEGRERIEGKGGKKLLFFLLVSKILN